MTISAPPGRPMRAGDVGGPEVELGPVAVVEGGVAAALLLGQDVDLGLELRVGLDGARLGQHLAALDLVALDAPQEAADVVAGPALVEQLLEHLDAGDDDLAGRLDPDHLDLVADLDDAALDPAGGDRPPALDPEDVLDRHEERLVDRPLGGRDVANRPRPSAPGCRHRRDRRGRRRPRGPSGRSRG